VDTAHFALERALSPHGPPGEPTVAAFAPGTFVEVRDADGTILGMQGGHRPGGEQLIPKLPDRIDGLDAADTHGGGSGPGEPRRYLTVGSATAGGPRFRVRASALPDGGQLVLALPLTETTDTLHRLLVVELAVTGGALVAAAAVGWWLVRVGLRPLADVEATAAAIAEGELDRRVPGDTATTEVGRLARALNVMLGRIQDAFAARDATEAELRVSDERLRRFVADASHELRTPLAAVAAFAELFERGADERPDDLARVMTGIRSETGRMGHLLEDLLLLARLDEGRPLEREPVDLTGLAAEAVETASAVGPEWPVQLDADGPVTVVGDPARLRQVLDNLLSNVRSHTPPGTTARVRVTGGPEEAVVEVTDNGPGLSEDEAARVFERFYRADPSRSRQFGGAGLGLGIVAAIVAAHGGQVSAEGTPGHGATFTVRLPVL